MGVGTKFILFFFFEQSALLLKTENKQTILFPYPIHACNAAVRLPEIRNHCSFLIPHYVKAYNSSQ